MTRRKIRYDPNDDFYSLLGISPSATVEEIHRAFRKHAKQVHPDLNPDNAEWAHGQFQRANDAHDILTDTALRAEYDQKRRDLLIGTLPGTRRSTAMAEASRAAWSRRNRRSRGPTMFLMAMMVFVGSCCMLNFGPEIQSGLTSLNANAPTSQGPILDPILAGTMTINAVAAVCPDPNSSIAEPANGATVNGSFAIRGTASGKNFQAYSVSLGFHDAVTRQVTWFPLESSVHRRIENDDLVPRGVTNILAAVIPGIKDDIVLRLVVRSGDGTLLPPCEIVFHFAKPSPRNNS